MFENTSKLDRITNIVQNAAFGKVLIVIDLPDEPGCHPAAIVGWESDGGVRTERGTHLVVLPPDRDGWLDSGHYLKSTREMWDDAVERAARYLPETPGWASEPPFLAAR